MKNYQAMCRSLRKTEKEAGKHHLQRGVSGVGRQALHRWFGAGAGLPDSSGPAAPAHAVREVCVCLYNTSGCFRRQSSGGQTAVAST